MVETIDGVKIDWSKFKVEANRNYNRAKKGYIDFVLKADEVGFVLDSDYTGNKDKVTLVYKLNNNIKLEIMPDSFKSQTYKSLKNIINNTNGDKFIRISRVEISDNRKDLILELQEGLFNTKFEISSNNYNSFVKCRETTYKYFIENNITVLSPYLGVTMKILVDFNCSHAPHWITPQELKRGNRCSKCSGCCPEQAKEAFIKVLTEEGYILLGEYINNKTKVKLQCPKGHIFYITPNHFKNSGSRCNQCNKSSGEQRVANILDKLNINYIFNQPFFGMKADKKFLKPDFYIPDLNIILEIDGGQHEKEIAFFGGKESFEKRQKNDRLKEDYCKKFGIEMFRIADTDKELETKVINIIEEKQKQVQAFNEALEEAREHIEAETDYYEFKNYLYSFFE